MIELELLDRDEDPTGFYGQTWTDEANTHVICEEDGRWFVRDEDGQHGSGHDTFDDAFATALVQWDEVTLAPANKLRRAIDVEDECDGMQYLTEYLATYGTTGIDAQALAQRVFERLEEG